MDYSKLAVLAEEEIASIIKVLPDEIRGDAELCQVLFEQKPDTDSGIPLDSLGVFQGSALTDQAEVKAPPLIRIFVGNIWEYTEMDEQDFLDEIGTTFLRELGNFLGWSEEEIAEEFD